VTQGISDVLKLGVIRTIDNVTRKYKLRWPKFDTLQFVVQVS